MNFNYFYFASFISLKILRLFVGDISALWCFENKAAFESICIYASGVYIENFNNKGVEDFDKIMNLYFC